MALRRVSPDLPGQWIVGEYARRATVVIGKKALARAFGILLATVFAALITVLLARRLSPAVALPIFIVLWIVIYFAGVWSEQRREELARKIPVNSKELRRRTKAFYDWLASQGRR